jgi:phage N-6-adenine-methyltransferase
MGIQTKEQNSFFERKAALFSYTTEEYITPKWLYDQLNEEFHFELDPCTTEDNPLHTLHYCTKDMDGLSKDWRMFSSVYVNPPYGRDVIKWVKKAYYSTDCGGTVVVMLLPARTDTKWFHDYIYKQSDVEIRFLRGRLKFGMSRDHGSNTAPFPSMIVIFR